MSDDPHNVAGFFSPRSGASSLPANADPSRVVRTVVEVRIRPGILYQPHPAFALDEDGGARYEGLAEADLREIGRAHV